MRVLKPDAMVGLPIASYGVSVSIAILGSVYGLVASCIPFTCFGNTAGADTRALHLLHEPHGDRPGLASSSHR